MRRGLSPKRWGTFAAIATILLVVGACTSQATPTSPTSSPSSSAGTTDHKVKKIAIALPAKASDYGWNQQGLAAAEAAAKSVGAELTTLPDIGYDNTAANLSQLAQQGANFIIAHASGYDDAAQKVAQQTKVPVMTYDIATLKTPGLVSNITTSGEQGGYLAGVLAALTTKTNTVGIAVSANDSNWFKMSGGFAAGVHSVNPSVKILFAVVGPAAYDDSAGGKRVAQTLISGNADVIFGMGDGASFGYLQAIETAKAGHKVWYIGDIGDMTPIDKNKVLLSSVLWDFTDAYKQAIKDIEAGTYGQEGYNLDLENGGISLLQSDHIPAEAWAKVEQAKQGITDGSITVPTVTKLDAVKKLLSGS